MRKLTIIAALLLLVPSVSQAKSLEDLLVEKGVITKGEARTAAHEHGTKVYWKKGTRIDFADIGFSTKIYTQLQTRYEFRDVDKDAFSGSDNTSSFSVKRARIGVAGSALHKEFDYKMEVDFAGGDGTLKDAWLKWNTCDWGGLKMGQFKSAVSRQNTNSSKYLQFPDRTLISDFFAFDRNQGLAADVALHEDWTLGAAIFNGNSDGEGTNSSGVDTKHLGVINVRGDLMGEMNPYVEGDIDHTDDAALNIGVAVGLGENELAALGGTVDETVVSADINFKYQGWSFNGEYFYLQHDPDVGESIEPTGFYAQAGYFIEPKEWEVAVRAGFLDCDDGAGIGNDIQGGIDGGTNLCASGGSAGAIDDVNEVGASINYYWWKHHLKAQLGYTFINQDFVTGTETTSEDDTQNNRWIFQLSSYF